MHFFVKLRCDALPTRVPSPAKCDCDMTLVNKRSARLTNRFSISAPSGTPDIDQLFQDYNIVGLQRFEIAINPLEDNSCICKNAQGHFHGANSYEKRQTQWTQ